MSTPNLRLTHPQRQVLEALLNGGPGFECTTGRLGSLLHLDPRHVKNYFGPRLMGLAKRGFLNRRMANHRALWSLGPMMDVLMEKELVVNKKIII